ncbi:pX69R [African swine fever virus]|uniref:PX69R n=1 Tax=African swine fever virus TaxID=10497 RepID=A0A8A1V473_ASF|nr:pX69R [African swine fever virus]
MLLYIVIIVACIIFILVPNEYWAIHLFFIIMIFMVYMYEKLDIHQKYQFWNYTMSGLSGHNVQVLCKCY